MERRGQNRQEQDPTAIAARIARDWLVGLGFLRLHAAVFAVCAAVLLVVNLIREPRDLWALDAVRTWLVVLACHGAAIAAGWVTWRAIRPHRLSELPVTLPTVRAGASAEARRDDVPTQPGAIPETHGWRPDAEIEPALRGPAPIAPRGRFSPPTSQPVVEIDEERTGIAGVLATIGDAALDLVDLGRAGVVRVRSLAQRGIAWVRDDDEDAETAPPVADAPQPPIPQAWEPPRNGAGCPPTVPPDPRAGNGIPVNGWQSSGPHPAVPANGMHDPARPLTNGVPPGESAPNGRPAIAPPASSPVPAPNGTRPRTEQPTAPPVSERSWMETAASVWTVRPDTSRVSRERSDATPPTPPAGGQRPAAGSG